MLASTTLAALPIGVVSPVAFAQCAIQPTANVQGSVTNTSPSTSPINCISISGITVTNNITNPSMAVIISETSFSPPTRTGITISNSSIGGAIVNAGQVNGPGILITNNATVSGGISNADTISAGGRGIDVFFASTFAGGISNSGTISAAPTGIFVFE